VITNFVPELSPSRPNPLSIEAMTSAPSTADFTCPRPPNSEVPPITGAAIEYRRICPPPAPVSTERSRDARMIPPRAAIAEQIANTMILTRSTLMPARRAASWLPPIAYT
jgi:hypothetical protein